MFLGPGSSGVRGEGLGSCGTGRLGFFHHLGCAGRGMSFGGVSVWPILLFFSISWYKSFVRALCSVFSFCKAKISFSILISNLFSVDLNITSGFLKPCCTIMYRFRMDMSPFGWSWWVIGKGFSILAFWEIS